jgi:aerobic carbon-monoxide dehydrogenase medium subunit
MTRHAEVERSPLVKQAIPSLSARAHIIGDPAGAQPRHDRRLDRQQRPRGGLSGGGRRGTVQTNRQADCRRRFLRRHVRDGTRPHRDRHRGPAAETAGGVLLLSASLSPARRAACASRSRVRNPASSAFPKWKPHSRAHSPNAIKNITIPQDGLNSDIHASAEYRAHLVGVMARRAVAVCG